MTSWKKVILCSVILLCAASTIQADDAGKGQFIWRSGTLSAARVEGSWAEMGAQSIDLSAVSPKDSMAYALNNIIAKQVADVVKFVPFQWFANLYLELAYFNRLESNILPEDEEMLRAVSAKSNIPLGVLRKAFVTPDAVGPLVLSGIKAARSLAGIQACSSFVAYGPRTATGERMLARNLDYPAVGSMDTATSVYLIKPDHGYKILTVTAEGFPIAGVSGLNEKGLVLVLHDAFSTKLSQSGTPIFSVNREVLEHAATIEQAIEIFKKYQYGSGWILHMTDRDPTTNEPRSAIVEVSGAGVFAKFGEDSYSVVTNSYQTPEQQNQELFISSGAAFHNRDRFNRLKELVTAKPVDNLAAMDILRDAYSASLNAEVDYSHTGIMSLDQVNSMVFLPDQGKVLVAEGTAPASFGAFYEFSFDQMEQGLAPVKMRDAIDKPPVVEEMVRAYESDFQNADHYEGYRHLILANKLSPDCGISLMAGAATLRMGDYASAKRILDIAVACPNFNPHQKAIANALRGLVQWNDGDNKDAIQSFETVRTTEVSLQETTGVPGTKDLVGLALDVEHRIRHGERPFPGWISDRARLDIKTGDNIVGWE